jgi:hypothetical protein
MSENYLRISRSGRQRHSLLRAPGDMRLMSQALGGPTIDTLQDLHRHLQTAIELEHATIPTYLVALYTLDMQRNAAAYRAIQGVVMEEMLHMIQVCNILNATGGHPVIDKPDFVPSYPTYLPQSNRAFLVPLQKFGRDTLDIFLDIEHPAPSGAPPEPDHYQTIGQFYKAIREAVVRLDAQLGGVFTGDPARQISAEQYYGGGGELIAIRNLADAEVALEEIVGQGEGVDDTIVDSDSVLFGQDIELAHYFRFNELRQDRRYQAGDTPSSGPTGAPLHIDWEAVIDMAPNPRLDHYPEGSPAWTQSMRFNRTYTQLLRSLHRATNGQPEVLNEAVSLMYALKQQALALLNLSDGKGRRAGPSFEYVAD